MQPVEKKKTRRSRPKLMLVLLAAILLVLGGTVLLLTRLNQTETYVPSGDVSSYGELVTREAADVSSVSVTLRSGDTWCLQRNANGDMALAGDPDAPLDSTMINNVLDAARVISYDDILSDDPEEYQPHLSEFGLEEPRCVAVFTYTDGTVETIRIGNRSDELDSSFYYMLVDGHAGLYALDISTADALAI